MPQPMFKNTGQGTAELSGDLTLHTVAALASEGDTDIQNVVQNAGTTWQLDLQHVGRFSSAGVALLLGWLRLCTTGNITMSVINVPTDMRGILSVCDLDSVFEPVITDA